MPMLFLALQVRNILGFFCKPVDIGTDAQSLDTNLRQKCIKHLSALPDADKGYKQHMPPGARADGWWGGPMPPEIARLSAVSVRII